MTDKLCTFGGDRDHTLIAYIYDDIDVETRAGFEAHVASCERCRDDIDALRGVRSPLSHWYPPQPRVRSIEPHAAARRARWWQEIPAWAQVAAALLILGVSAGIANLDVRHDANGFTVRTGWSKPAEAPAQPATPVNASASVASRADVAALEERLRAEIRALETATASPAAAKPGATDAELLRKVRALIDESERREQRELALRIAQVITDVNAQRLDDLRKIDVSLRGVQHNLGVEVLKQQQSLNYLATRVSQRQ